jgi:hypothetical protein
MTLSLKGPMYAIHAEVSRFRMRLGHFYFAQIGHYHFAATNGMQAIAATVAAAYNIDSVACVGKGT